MIGYGLMLLGSLISLSDGGKSLSRKTKTKNRFLPYTCCRTSGLGFMLLGSLIPLSHLSVVRVCPGKQKSKLSSSVPLRRKPRRTPEGESVMVPCSWAVFSHRLRCRFLTFIFPFAFILRSLLRRMDRLSEDVSKVCDSGCSVSTE